MSKLTCNVRWWKRGLFLAVSACLFAAPAALAQTPPFRAALDREAVAPGEPFVYEVTLTLADQDFDALRPPDFGNLTVLAAPGGPNRAMSVQMGGGATHVENRLTWRWELALPANAKSGVTIGAARVRVGGREIKSNTVQVRVGASTGGRQQSGGGRAAGGAFPRGLFPGLIEEDPLDGAVASSPGTAFIRAIADKPKAFVGEQVNVSWLLYLTEPQSNFRPITQPRSEGFWSEDLPSTNPQNRLAFTDRVEGGRRYQVAVLQSKALFPLAPGKLTVTAMEAEVSQADFFGRAVRARRLKSDPLTVEAVALPRDGQPAGFDGGNVGRYELSAALDRSAVGVGDAVTIKIIVSGRGNLRNVHPPVLPALAGWKSYEPKSDVAVELGEVVSGTKTVEWVIRPERPGKTVIPALAMATFDPTARRYAELRTTPIEIVVAGDAAAPTAGAPVPALQAGSGDNPLAATIRPIRVRERPGREVGVALLAGPAFTATLVAPPLAFAALTLAGRVRRKLGADSGRSRRRRLRLAARRRLRAAEAHRAEGRVVPFYVEIDRVLREVLSERLAVPVAGLRLDELSALLTSRGLPAAQVARIEAALEGCDRARFAPGGETTAPAALSAALAEAEEIFDIIERAELTGGPGPRA